MPETPGMPMSTSGIALAANGDIWKYTGALNGGMIKIGTFTPATPPTNTVAPVASIVTGGTAVGAQFACNNGTWVPAVGGTATKQWRGNGVAIAGATGNTYVVTDTDVDTTIDCLVTFTNAAGSASAASNSLGPITAPAR